MAGELRFSMLFQANAAQAKAEVAAMRAELLQLTQSVTDTGTASASAAPEIGAIGQATSGAASDMIAAAQGAAEWDAIVGAMRAELQPMVAEFNALSAAMQQLSVYEEIGALNADEAAQAHDRLSRAATDLLGRMEAAGVSLDGTTAAMSRQESSVQGLINRLTGVSTATGETIADTLRHGQALDTLRARFNPLFAASRQYEMVLHDIAEAERLGALSAMEASAARDRAALSLAPIPDQLGRVGVSSGAAAANVANLGYQVNDIAMMMSLGQSPFMLMAQQGPQVVQILHQLQSSGQAIGPAIAGAFRMMLNPMALVTLAVIGFGAAAVKWFTSAEAEVKSVRDAMQELGDIQSRIDKANDILGLSVSELIDKYGRYAQAAKNAARAVREHSIELARARLTEGVAAAADQWDQYAAKMDAATARREYKSAEEFAGQGVAVELSAEVTATQQVIKNLQKDLKVSESDAIRLADAFAKVRDAASFEDRLRSLTQLQSVISAIEANGPKLSLDADIRAAIVEAAELNLEMVDLASTVDDVTSAIISMIAAAPGGGWLAGAIGDAATLASTLWDAAVAAAAARSAELDAAAKVRTIPGGVDAVADGTVRVGQNGWRRYVEPKVPGSSGSGAGRGASGGGGGAAKEETSALQKLIDEQTREIEALRILGPLQEEIAKHHEALKGATDKERASVAELIEERMRLEDVRARLEEIEQAGKDAFTGLVTGAITFQDAIGNVLMKLAEMAASDAWDLLWGGGVGGGKSGGFGGLGSLIGGFLGLADGGMVFGPGGPRDDAVPAWLSNGEFVVNAEATAGALPLLELINAGVPLGRLIDMIGGKAPAFADGGLVGLGSQAPDQWAGISRGQGASALPSQTLGGKVQVEILFDPKQEAFSAYIRSVSGEVSADQVMGGLEHFSAQVLPGRLSEIEQNPRVIG